MQGGLLGCELLGDLLPVLEAVGAERGHGSKSGVQGPLGGEDGAQRERRLVERVQEGGRSRSEAVRPPGD